MSTIGELLVPRYEKEPRTGNLQKNIVDSIVKDLGADSLIYQSVEGLIKSIGVPKKDLCTACVTGDYPTPYGKKLYRKAWENFRKGVKERTYSC